MMDMYQREAILTRARTAGYGLFGSKEKPVGVKYIFTPQFDQQQRAAHPALPPQEIPQSISREELKEVIQEVASTTVQQSVEAFKGLLQDFAHKSDSPQVDVNAILAELEKRMPQAKSAPTEADNVFINLDEKGTLEARIHAKDVTVQQGQRASTAAKKLKNLGK